MREIRLYGSEGGGAVALPTPIPRCLFVVWLKVFSEERPVRHCEPGLVSVAVSRATRSIPSNTYPRPGRPGGPR